MNKLKIYLVTAFVLFVGDDGSVKSRNELDSVLIYARNAGFNSVARCFFTIAKAKLGKLVDCDFFRIVFKNFI